MSHLHAVPDTTAELPHDYAAEAQVLGAMLHSRDAINTALGLLTEADLWRGTHKRIWRAIANLHTRGVPVDPITVADQLDSDGHLADVGPDYLVDLSAGCIAPANCAHHARIVASCSARRRQVELGRALERRGLDSTADPSMTTGWALTQLEDSTTARRTVPLLLGDEIETLADPVWLVQGLLPEGLSVIHGRRSSAKSFLAMAWAFSIATGATWHGRRVRTSPVVYVIAEGAGGAKQRRRAWMQATHTGRMDHLGWVPTALDPADPADASALARHIERAGAGLVVLDTVARCMAGEENSTEDMKRFVAGCDRLRERTGASVLLVHHSDKQDTGMRGNTALGDACDGIVHMRANADGSKTMRPEKAKDAEVTRPMTLSLKPFGPSVVLVEDDTPRPDPLGAL